MTLFARGANFHRIVLTRLALECPHRSPLLALLNIAVPLGRQYKADRRILLPNCLSSRGRADPAVGVDPGPANGHPDPELLQAGPLSQYLTVTIFPLFNLGDADLLGSAQLDEQEMDGKDQNDPNTLGAFLHPGQRWSDLFF